MEIRRLRLFPAGGFWLVLKPTGCPEDTGDGFSDARFWYAGIDGDYLPRLPAEAPRCVPFFLRAPTALVGNRLIHAEVDPESKIS